MKVVFIDVETTGLKPKKHYIWQIAWITAIQQDKTLKLIKAKEKLLLPFGKKHPKRLMFLVEELKNANLVVGHNIDFERSFLYEYGIWIPRKNSYCTMLKSKDLCNLKYMIQDYYGWDRHLVFTKYPKLSEAVQILLNEPINQENLHDALYDVMLTAKLYAKLEGLQMDDTNLKVYRKPLKKLYGLLFSPMDPYQTQRQNLIEKLKNTKAYKLWNRLKNQWQSLQNNIKKQEELPF